MYDTFFGVFRVFRGPSKLEETEDSYKRTCSTFLAGIQPRKVLGSAA